MELEYNDYVKNLRDDDILDQKDKLYKIGKLKTALESSFDNDIPNILTSHLKSQKVELAVQQANTDWFTEGVNCQILKAGSDGWQTGKLKVKVSVEFIPDQPEIPEYQSPLDEIRNHPSFSNTQ